MNRTLLASLTIKVAEKSMDMLIRAAILEGAAGVHRYSWLGPSANMSGVNNAFDKALETMPGLNPLWVSRQETGFHLGLVKVLRAKLGRDPEMIDELVNDIVSGLSLPPNGELYAVGKYLSDEIQNGADPRGAASLLMKHGSQRAISALRKKREESLTTDTEEGGSRERDIPVTVDDDKLLDIVLADPRVQQAFMNAVQSRFKGTERGLEIVNYWLEHPNEKNVEISKALGIPVSYGAATLVGRVINKAREAFMNEVQTNPKLQGLIEMIMERENLGYGIRAAKKSS